MKNIIHRHIFTLLFLFVLPGLAQGQDLVTDKSFGADNEIIVTFSQAVDPAAASETNNYTV